MEEVHTFSWSADSRTIYFATRHPWTKTQKDDYKKQWKDVEQYRTAERGDTIFALDVAAALADRNAAPAKEKDAKEKEKTDEKKPDLTPGARILAGLRMLQGEWTSMITSPDGSKLAFLTNTAISQRQEKNEDVRTLRSRSDLNTGKDHVAQLPSAAIVGSDSKLPAPRQLTHNQAVGNSSALGQRQSPHLFHRRSRRRHRPLPRPATSSLLDRRLTLERSEQWNKDFTGEIASFGSYGNGAVVTARLGTEVQMYVASDKLPSAPLRKFDGWPGTYENPSTGLRSLRVAFVYSSLTRPSEVYLAEGPNLLLQSAHPITALNKLFAERNMPQGKPYRWKADDGTTIEGMLIYPPGSFEPGKPERKNLPMFTFIHGGPAEADGDYFEADWYKWGALAATNGWLVFEPNYRGSTGYGDKFLMRIVPQIVSRPGKDILEGVDALVKDGIADPDHLTIGGYSYGGYMDQLAHHPNHALQSRCHRS